ncbi:MAG: adenylate/guanylate cyclase domain-containing protein [Alphaproteobacteria bacterium]|nr:adenylate/guanylate cyclase domain-containing protein [Alphaproteobacteria bacterium]MCY4318544.1 adenylate/guanylate cyclase domain-containing protein [Alphaproteobacteria bacterium]
MTQLGDTGALAGAPPTAIARGRRRLSLSWLLALCFGSLIAVSILVVLGVAVYSATRNTVDLLQDRADLEIEVLSREVESLLESARDQAGFVARMLEAHEVDPDDPDRFSALLLGAMAADPAIGALLYIRPDGQALLAERNETLAQIQALDLSKDETTKAALSYGSANKEPAWVPPIYLPDYDSTVIVLQIPVYTDDRFRGVLAVALGMRTLSEFLQQLADGAGPNTFVLYGKENVLAHRIMAPGYPGLSLQAPLPALAGFGDGVLARMWHLEAMRPSAIPARPPLANHLIEVSGEQYLFLYRELDGYTEVPLIVGAYFEIDVVSGEVNRLFNSLVVGLAALALAVLLALFIGRRLARPVSRLSTVAHLVGELRLDDIRELPRSRVKELDEQSAAFNAMTGALRWFQAYVPRSLVHQLMREGDLASLASDRRNVTVMFSDIVGYSTISEGKGPAEVADLLNKHFGILTAAIEAEGGTVDKFIGDGVMAFWGAPEKQKHRAVRACRAALAIRDGIAADNRERERRGKPPVRLRLGIHSGRATAGNIGPPSRINYTVIGDDVNIAHRLEQLGKQVSPDAEVAITVSASTVTDLDELFETELVGEIEVKGRAAPVAVYRLVGLA